MRNPSNILLLLCAVTCCVATAFASPAVIEAPAIRWATPLDSGPLRVLYIAPRFATWDAGALAERLEMDLKILPVWRTTSLGYDPAILEEHTAGFSTEEVGAALAEALKREYDLYIIANLDPAILPESILSEIVTRVAQGAGLLLANVSWHGHGPLQIVLDSAEVPDPSTPGEVVTGVNLVRRAEHLRLGLVNGGRIADFDYPESPSRRQGLLPEPPGPALYEPAYVDEAMSLMARVAMWAAGREREIRITGLTDRSPEGPNPEEIPPDLPEEYIDSLKDLPMQQPMRPFIVRLNAPAPRRMDLRVQVRERGRPVPAYSVTETVEKGQEEITTFLFLGSGRITVDAWLESRKGIIDWASREIEIEDWPEVQSLRADKTWLLQNDRLQLNVRVRPVHSRYRSATLYARAEDNLGRIVAETHQRVDASGGEVNLTLELADLLAPLLTVELYALAGEHPNPSSFVLGVNEPHRLYFPVRLPDDQPGLELVAATPDVVGASTFAYMRALATAGLDTVYAPAGNEALVQSAAAGLRLVPEVGAWQGGSTFDGLYREPCLSDSAYTNSEAGQVGDNTLQHWAGGSARYGLGNPSFYCATDEPVCQSPNCLASFIEAGYLLGDKLEKQPEFWSHRGDVFGAFLGRMAAAARAVDTDASSGFRAIGGNDARFGYDWYKLLAGLDWIATDPEPLVHERLRSYSSRHSFSGVVLGGRVRPDSDAERSAHVWRAALAGLGSVWLDSAFGAADIPSASSWLSGSGEGTAPLSHLADIVATVNAAAGPLLASAEATPAQIALLDHPGSAHASRLTDDGADLQANSERAMVDLLNALGYPWRFMRVEEINTARPVAIFLPHCGALTPEESATLASRASDGTMLVTDEPLVFLPDGWVPIAEVVDTPSLGILLGPPNAAGSYLHLSNGIDDALSKLQIDNLVPLIDAQGGSPGLERFRYTLGGAELFGLLARPDVEPQKVTIAFDKKDHVYDIIEGVSVLRPHRNPIRLEPGSAALFARLPYEVEKLSLVVPDTVQAGTRLAFQCMVSVEDGRAEDHLVMAELIPIGGIAARHHKLLIRCRGGVGKAYFPLARNIPLGYYTLRIRDLLSGMDGEQELKVVPPMPVGGTLEVLNE